jgi:predicted nucleic acid-binding Zn ribbon protein
VSAGHFFPRRSAEPLGGILQRALDRHGLSRQLDRHVPAAVWSEAVGAEIASRAQPTVLSAGTLHVLVQDHRWRDQIDAARVLIIERLNRRLGRGIVRALQFGLAHEGALRPRQRQ